MELHWMNGPMLISDRGWAVGVWLNRDLTPWNGEGHEPMWFGRRSWVAENGGARFERTIVALGVVALVRNVLLEE